VYAYSAGHQANSITNHDICLISFLAAQPLRLRTVPSLVLLDQPRCT
jgi:hypothetical protein